ncbi:hypothetical protein K2X85_14400 [bacterium]|nr:hypothetical protein [bacterium]
MTMSVWWRVLGRWRRGRIFRGEKSARVRGDAFRFRVVFMGPSRPCFRDYRTRAAARELFDRLASDRRMLVDLERGILDQRGPAVMTRLPWDQNILGPDEPFAFF